MRRLLALLGMVALLQAQPAHALMRRTLVVGAGASFLVQPESFTDQWNTGFALAGALYYDLLPILTVGVEVGYSRHGLDDEAVEASMRDTYPNVNVSGGDLWVLPVNVVGELDLLRWGAVKPFVRAGLGVYTLGTTDFEASGFGSDQVVDEFIRNDPSQTVFGTLIGLGVRTPLSLSVSLSIDATYQMAATEGESTHFVPVRLVLSF